MREQIIVWYTIKERQPIIGDTILAKISIGGDDYFYNTGIVRVFQDNVYIDTELDEFNLSEIIEYTIL